MQDYFTLEKMTIILRKTDMLLYPSLVQLQIITYHHCIRVWIQRQSTDSVVWNYNSHLKSSLPFVTIPFRHRNCQRVFAIDHQVLTVKFSDSNSNDTLQTHQLIIVTFSRMEKIKVLSTLSASLFLKN